MAGQGDPIRRLGGSHIREDGMAKVCFETEEEAIAHANIIWIRTGKPTNHYPCAQKPLHWHVGKGTPDLERK